MKTKIITLIFVCLFLVSLVSADNIAQYEIVADRIEVNLNFENADNLEVKIPYEASELKVNTDYTLEEGSLYNTLKINSASNLNIAYSTESLIDKSGSTRYFTLKNKFDNPIDIEIHLDEGEVLVEEGILFPSPDEIETDGRRIILNYNNFEQEDILIEYEIVKKGSKILYWLILLLVFAIILVYLLQNRKFKKELKKVKEKSKSKKSKGKKEQEIMKNLYEDEKEIVQYLLKRKKNEAWTKEIAREVGISKVKLSRKLRSLKAKGVVEKIPYGNENRIRLKTT